MRTDLYKNCSFKVINARTMYEKKPNEIACFLAGGMSNTGWIDTFMDTLCGIDRNILRNKELQDLVIYNPYNEEIEMLHQIFWEYKYLNSYVDTGKFIFSVYFDKYTDQPISLFELGKILGHLQYKNFGFVASAHPEYKKLEEVQMQCVFCGYTLEVRDPFQHAHAVVDEYKRIKEEL